MKILVTCFDGFAGESVNASALALERLPKKIGAARLITAELPTRYAAAEEVVKRLIAIHSPAIIVHLGQAAGRSCPELERIGINFDNAKTGDNAGEVRLTKPIDPDGEDGLFSTLPVDAMAEACRAAGIPAGVSNTAGTFVCNHILYTTLRYIKTHGLPIRAGFIHLPVTCAQALDKRYPTMDSQTSADAVTAMLERAIACIDEPRIMEK